MKQKCLAETGYERRASFGRRVTLLLGSSLALLSTPAAAEESPEPVIERVRYDARATGDWFGLRSELASVGIDIFAKYDFITSAVIGPTEDTGFTGDLFFGLALSLEQAVGWEGASLAVTGLNRHGNSVDASVQGLYSVQQNFGGQHTFLYNLTFEQKLFEGRLSLKLGRMTATDDFAGSPLFSRYLNNSINGQIRAVLFDGVMTSYPFAVWGARARVDWSEQVYTMVGTFQLSARMWDRELQGADFSVRGGDGASVFSQVGWTPTLGPRRLRGHYYVGANSAFFDMPRFDGDGSDGFLLRTYAHLSQEVFRESEDSDDGLTLFANLAYSPHEQLALVPLQISAGAQYDGLVPERDDDIALFGATYGMISSAHSDARVAAGEAARDYELMLELGYRIALTAYFYVQPDLQWVVNPGGTGERPDALVAGAQWGLVL